MNVATSPGDKPAPAPDVRRSALGQLLVLLGLTGFAIAQPMLDILGRNPTVFTFHDVEGLALAWIALAIAFVPPLVLWGIGRLVSLVDGRAGYVVHLVTVAGLSALTALQVLHWTVGLTQPAILVVLSAAIAGGFTFLYARFRPVAQWARYTSVLPVIAVLLFVVGSSSGDLVRGSRSAAGRTDAGDMPSVVFVLLDEMPTKSLLAEDGTIDEVRFPNLASFAEDATWYRHFTTVAPFSNQAIPSILTGRDPEIVEPLWTEYPDNLFTLLEPTHDLSVFESFTKLCGSDACVEGPPGSVPESSPEYGRLADTLLDVWTTRVSPGADGESDFDDFDEAESVVEIPSADFPAFPTADDLKVRPGRHQDFLDALVPSDRPSLHFLHLVLPHSPFRFYPNGEIYDPVYDRDVYPSSRANDRGEWAAAFTEQRHIWQARYTDALVGAILDELKATDRYDESLVVVMSDHGASFETRTPFRNVTRDNLDAIAYTPLLIKAPGQETGEIDDSNLMSVDVLPTIAEILDVEVPWEVDGSPAGSAAIDERGSVKYIYDLAGSNIAIRLEEVLAFDDVDHAPSAAGRSVAPARPDDYPGAGVLRQLGFDEYVGRSLDEVATDVSNAMTAEVLQRKRIVRPEGGVPPGWVQGTVPDAPDDALVLVEVNGEIVTASPIYSAKGTDKQFAALLPPQTLRERNELRLGVVTSDGVVEATVAN